MLNKSVFIDAYICVFCSINFGQSSEFAAEAAALVPLAAVAAYLTHVQMALPLLPAVSGTLQKKEKGKKITEADMGLAVSLFHWGNASANILIC